MCLSMHVCVCVCLCVFVLVCLVLKLQACGSRHDGRCIMHQAGLGVHAADRPGEGREEGVSQHERKG